MNPMEIEPIWVAISLVAGVIVGMGYFAGLWITVQQLTTAKRPVLLWAFSALLRAAGATAVFYVLVNRGMTHALLGILGFIGARFIATRIWGPVREPRIPGSRPRDDRR